MKYTYELDKEDYIQYAKYVNTIENSKKHKSLFKSISNRFFKAGNRKKYIQYVNDHIRKDLKGRREFTVEKDVVKVHDMRIELVLHPKQVKKITRNKNHLYLYTSSQSFIIKHKDIEVIIDDLEHKGYKVT